MCIRDRYHFDSDGRLETGWIEDDMYYCNASGEMLTGWQQLYSPDEEDSDSVTPGYDSPVSYTHLIKN